MNMIVNQAGQVSEVSNEELIKRLDQNSLAAAPVFQVGDISTCQFGNPSDTNYVAETHEHVPVIILATQNCEITKITYYLVAKLDDREYIGRASDVRGRRHCGDIQGEMYCTNARMFGSKAQKWTGIETFYEAARSLGFDVTELRDPTLDRANNVCIDVRPVKQ